MNIEILKAVYEKFDHINNKLTTAAVKSIILRTFDIKKENQH